MKRLVGVVLVSLMAGSLVPPTPARGDVRVGLRVLAVEKKVYIGNMLPGGNARELKDLQLMKSLCTEFNMLTAGNALKWELIHPEPDIYRWGPAEKYYAAAKACGMKFMGGPLLWKWQLPDWLQALDGQPARLRAALKEHVMKVVGHFKGRIPMWDVVNEAIDWGGELTRDIWSRNLGPNYAVDVFKWAHQADPTASLWYNDFASEGFGPKGNGVHYWVTTWLKKGAPIHGVGFQAHGILEAKSQARLIANLRRYAALGLETRMSEVAIPIGPRTARTPSHQAAKYRMLAEACFAPRTGCRMFTVWGVSDRDFRPVAAWKGTCCGVLLDENFEPKPAYFAVKDALAQA